MTVHVSDILYNISRQRLPIAQSLVAPSLCVLPPADDFFGVPAGSTFLLQQPLLGLHLHVALVLANTPHQSR